MNRWDTAYTLPTVIIIISILTLSLSITTLYISHFIGASYRQINASKGWSDHYAVLEEVRGEFEEDIQDDYTSPWSGWYSQLPEEIDGYSITYTCEDSKLDINHLDPKIIGASGLLPTQPKEKQEPPAYYYYQSEVNELYPSELADSMTINQLPCLNTSSIASLTLFLQTQPIKESTRTSIISYIKSRRSGRKYITFKGLLIGKQQYEQIRQYFPRTDQDTAYRLLDYKGRLNCNVVDKQTFLIAAKACNPSKQPSAESYWNVVAARQEAKNSIKDIKNIFGNQWQWYQKFFSVDSNLFKITITRDTKEISALIRRYQDFRGKNHTALFLLRAYTIEEPK